MQGRYCCNYPLKAPCSPVALFCYVIRAQQRLLWRHSLLGHNGVLWLPLCGSMAVLHATVATLWHAHHVA